MSMNVCPSCMPRLLVLGAVGASLAPGTAVAAPVAVYAGRAIASDNFAPVVIQTKGSRITQVAMRWETTCTSGYRFVFKGVFKYAGAMPKGGSLPGGALVVGQSKLFAGPVARNGKFKAELFGTVDIGSTAVLATQTTEISGVLKKTSGAGSYSAKTVIGPVFTGPTPPENFTPDVCDSGAWTFFVQRGPRVFGGASEQGDPIVVLLNAKKRSVSDFIFGWRADGCERQGTWWDFPDHYKNFPVDRTGSFVAAFSDPVTSSDGSKVVFGYNINGRLKGKRASGTFGVSPLIMDSQGQQIGSCSTPNLKWTALSG